MSSKNAVRHCRAWRRSDNIRTDTSLQPSWTHNSILSAICQTRKAGRAEGIVSFRPQQMVMVRWTENGPCGQEERDVQHPPPVRAGALTQAPVRWPAGNGRREETPRRNGNRTPAEPALRRLHRLIGLGPVNKRRGARILTPRPIHLPVITPDPTSGLADRRSPVAALGADAPLQR